MRFFCLRERGERRRGQIDGNASSGCRKGGACVVGVVVGVGEGLQLLLLCVCVCERSGVKKKDCSLRAVFYDEDSILYE